MRVCLSDNCPIYRGSLRRAEYVDDIVQCADCGGTLTMLADEAADHHHRPPADVHLRAVLLVGAGALVICGVLYLIVVLLPSRVHFVNGLDRPLTIELGDSAEKIELAPRTQQSCRLAGRHHIIVRVQQELITDEWIDVPRNTDLVVYNVLGAADLCLTRHTYVADKLPADHPARLFGSPQVTRLRGKRLVIENDVSDIFRPAPARINVDSREAGWSKERGQLDFCP